MPSNKSETLPEFVHSLGLKNSNEWIVWAKTDEKPDDIPADVSGTYKDRGWSGWGDWLGNGKIATFKKSYRPSNKFHRSFEEAREFVHSLGLKNRNEWRDWCKTNLRLDDIPANPESAYKNRGWVSWGDWLGTGTVAPQDRLYCSFEEARTFVHTLKFKNQEEWRKWSKTKDKPDNIPADPEHGYKNRGWIGWGDWLGIINQWRPRAILSFLHSLQPILSTLEGSELYAIMRQNGMLTSIYKDRNNAKFLKSIKSLCSSNNLEDEYENLIVNLEKETGKENSGFSNNQIDDLYDESDDSPIQG